MKSAMPRCEECSINLALKNDVIAKVKSMCNTQLAILQLNKGMHAQHDIWEHFISTRC